MLKVRTFLNADLRVLYRIYVAHHGKFGPPLGLSFAQFEQAIFSRVFFEPRQLLVATLEEEVVGWCQYFTQTISQDSETRNNHVIANLCSLRGDTQVSGADESVSEQLLQSVIERTHGDGGTLTAGIVRDDDWGYAGLEPLGAGYGVSINDLKFTNLLQENGFTIASQHVRFQVSTDQYRAPMNREVMDLRRKCSLQSDPGRAMTTRMAAALSHVDILTYSLVDRGGNCLASLNVWLSDPDAEVMNPSCAILHQPDPAIQGVIDSAQGCLIGMIVAELPKRGIQQIEMVLDESASQALDAMEKLRFQSTDRGIVLVRNLGLPGGQHSSNS